MSVNYPYIRAWGEMCGTFQSYDIQEVQRAERMKALVKETWEIGRPVYRMKPASS